METKNHLLQRITANERFNGLFFTPHECNLFIIYRGKIKRSCGIRERFSDPKCHHQTILIHSSLWMEVSIFPGDASHVISLFTQSCKGSLFGSSYFGSFAPTACKLKSILFNYSWIWTHNRSIAQPMMELDEIMMGLKFIFQKWYQTCFLW